MLDSSRQKLQIGILGGTRGFLEELSHNLLRNDGIRSLLRSQFSHDNVQGRISGRLLHSRLETGYPGELPASALWRDTQQREEARSRLVAGDDFGVVGLAEPAEKGADDDHALEALPVAILGFGVVSENFSIFNAVLVRDLANVNEHYRYPYDILTMTR